MKVQRTRTLAAIAAIGALVSAALIVVPARATPPDKVTTSTIGVGRFTDIDTKVKTDINPGTPTKFWKARIKTKGISDLHVLQNTIAPGGSFGWHSHPGPSLVIVKSGTATFYLAADPTCTPHGPGRGRLRRPGPRRACRAQRGQRRPGDSGGLAGPGGVRPADRRAEPWELSLLSVKHR
jgi:hypothetical protein